MINTLKDLRDLVDLADTYKPGLGVPEPPDEDEIARCIQVMLSHQCIYPDQRKLGPSYRILSAPAYQGFFRKYFSAMGLELYHDTRSGMVALKVPTDGKRYGFAGSKLKHDETVVLVALRLAYEEAFRSNQFTETGAAEITTDDLYDRLETVGGMRVERPRLNEILTNLKRKGVVKIGERDPVEDVQPLTVLPGVEVTVPLAYVEHLILAAEAAKAAAESTDGAGVSQVDDSPSDDSASEGEDGDFESEDGAVDPHSGGVAGSDGPDIALDDEEEDD